MIRMPGKLALLCAAAAILASQSGGCNTEPTYMENLELERDLMKYGFKVVKILAGDCFVVDLSNVGDPASFRNVRLAGVDAPNLTDFMEAGGRDAVEFLDGRIRDKYVMLKFDTGFYGYLEAKQAGKGPVSPPAGAYIDPDTGAIHAHVYMDGVSLNRLMLLNGFAKMSRTYPFSRETDREEFMALEREARAERRGLWR